MAKTRSKTAASASKPSGVQSMSIVNHFFILLPATRAVLICSTSTREEGAVCCCPGGEASLRYVITQRSLHYTLIHCSSCTTSVLFSVRWSFRSGGIYPAIYSIFFTICDTPQSISVHLKSKSKICLTSCEVSIYRTLVSQHSPQFFTCEICCFLRDVGR